jgi:menaquinol-cytochrome c reductase iron-sulfur subunit
MDSSISHEPRMPCCACGTEPRRGFLARLLGWLAGALTLAAPLGTGLVALLNPLRQKGQGGQFVRLATLATLPEDGTPLKATVVMDSVDAWNRAANQPVGAVFLCRVGRGQVVAFNVVCPHAGCSVEYVEKTKRFFCPCHVASFDLSGKRTDAVSPSPRDLDQLEVDAERLHKDNEVWVRFQNFQTGIAKQVPIA